MKNPIPLSSRSIRSFFGFGLLLAVILALALIRPATAGTSALADSAIRHDSSKGLTAVALTIIVNALGDAADINVGDGVCDTDAGTAGNQCTLRAALQETNFVSSADTINFSLPANSIITLDTSLPSFSGNTTIVGPGSALLTIQRSTAAGTPNFRFFTFFPINGNFNNSISGLTLVNGLAPTGSFFGADQGGAIFNANSCTLTLTDVVIRGNNAPTGGGLYNAGMATLTNTIVSGNNATNGGGIYNSYAGFTSTLTLTNSAVDGNRANNGVAGGIFSGGSTLSVVRSTISGNTCDAQGGGIYNGSASGNPGIATLTNSTVSGNNATGFLSNGVGGIYNASGGNTATLTNTTLTANTASGTGSGVAGIFNGSGSTANLKNSIVAQNTSALMLHDLNGTFNSQGYNLIGKSDGTNGFTNGVNGDQVGTYATPIDPKLGVLTDNAGPTKTHALLVGSPAIDAGNSALTTDQRGQPRPTDDQTVVNAAGGNASDIGAYEAHNLEVNLTADADDGACRAIGTGNGCTLREAINAANAETGAELIVFSAALTSSGPATINLASPLPNIADDVTLTGPGASQLTVRRNSGGFLRIFNVTATGIVSFSGLTIADGVADLSGGGIQNFSTGTVSVIACTLSGNSVPNGFGGGIFNKSTGTVNVTGSTLSGNSAPNASGGAISNSSGGTVSVINSTITANQASTAGGGLDTDTGTLNVINSTLSGNSVTFGSGGGIVSGTGTVNITNSTLRGNSAVNGGGVAKNINGTVNARNTIIAGNSASSNGPDISGNFTSRGNNLIGKSDGGSGFTDGFNNDEVGTVALPLDPLLGSLQNNGGPTQTHALLAGSIAIDAGNNCVLTDTCSPSQGFSLATDQRGSGFNRATDGNGDGVSTVDIGAYEIQSILVTNTADGGAGSFRQAITDANINPGSFVINFQAGLTGTITLLSGLPDLSASMDINGPGATQLTIQRSTAGGTPNFRIFTINSGKVVAISGLTISNGSAPTGGVFPANTGGAILNLGSLQLSNTVVSGNTAQQGGGISSSGPVTLQKTIVSGNTGTSGGGGISTQGGSSPITIVDSTVSGNTTNGSGGGLLNSRLAAAMTLTIRNSTISGNNAGGNGGGIYNSGTQGAVLNVTLTNVTISGNNSGFGGGIANSSETSGTTVNLAISNGTVWGNSVTGSVSQGGGIANHVFGSTNTLTLRNTMVAANLTNPGASNSDISSPVDPTSSFNLIGDGTGMSGISNGSNGNMVGTSVAPIAPLVNLLANNGGPTQTHALLSGSPALDAGNNALVVNPPFSGPPFTDQRGAGFARIVDGPDADASDTVDIGAFEAQVSVADIADQTINEDGLLSLPFNVGGAASITSVTATSSNANLVPNNPANISLSGSGSSRTLVINPLADAFGTSTITVTVNGNNSQTMTDTFLLTVNSVNDVPSFTKGQDQTVNENDGAQTVNNGATNISAGPANESGQALTFIIANNSNPALFAAAPAISSSGVLTYTPATGVSGMATITIALMDNGGTANGGSNTSATQSFNINVLEGGTLQFSSATFSTPEDGANAVVTVTRTGGAAGEARVNYATSNNTATAGQDYTTASGTLIFADGITTQTFSVAINNDDIDEADETINLTLTNAAGSGSLGTPASAVLTIIDNDPTPGISIDDIAINERDSGSANATLTVSLSGQSSQTVTVNFATANGTATAGSDYQSNSGTVTFLPLETTRSINVTVNGDITFEPDEDFLVNLSNPVNATIDDNQGSGTIFNDDAEGGFLGFSQPIYTVAESGGFTTITVTRTNDISRAATVQYFTRDYSSAATEGPCTTISNIASSRCDYTTASGTLRFAAGESSKTFLVLISQDNYVEGLESLSLNLSSPTGGAILALTSTATLRITDDITEPATNPIDTAEAFVRQHYHDFLNREPDAAGLAFWSNQITECQQPGATCSAEVRRINVSAAFFLSIEFQETGFLVYRMYKAGYGNIPGGPVPVHISDFLPDTQQLGKGVVVGETGWELVLENNKQAYVLDFVSRSRFTTAFPTALTPPEFVDALYSNAGVTPSTPERNAAINEFGGAGNTADSTARARALRRVAENSTLGQQETNKAFVLMQYFGYLRRNPNDVPEQTLNFDGYNFWLGKLNQFNGNFVNAEMVKAFIVSSEYRHRFGP